MLLPTRSSRRALSLARRALHTRAQTYYSPTPDFLAEHLASNPLPSLSKSTSLFLLSTTLPHLAQNLLILQTFFPNHIASFSITPPGSEPTLSLATFTPDESAGEGVKVWRSDLSGRPPAEVGRFQRPEKQREEQRVEEAKGKEQGEAEMRLAGEGWAGMWRGENEVGRIEALEGVKAESFLMLSDGRPGPVLRALDELYPTATKTGILTAATPFITERPHTLLHNGQIHEAGTIGLAFTNSATTETHFGLSAMTEPVTISGAQGNMLLSIDGTNSNPTQMLIGAIQRRGGVGLTKDEDFYLGLLEQGDVKRVVKILSGDPSRGALSVDMEDPLLVGQTVQFMHRSTPVSPVHPSPSLSSITFSSIPKSDEVDDVPVGTPRVVDGFLGLSEGGFIYSNPSSAICTAPGATTTWRI
ncbi:hypothetical protein CI109_103540 [Kwoniella shandongensis]|uniref:Uncharacterized protein n=1 Tax=Kwoniella shandongensis TaxID=1734106 RepID=A0A5M6BWF4_9TREE|nr:uncharacterized protein CI109_004558 [Kwoniella shandongensis]KAA5527023.1 hypothetical protein CI109_004558 [Kwoniella shandongensis]